MPKFEVRRTFQTVMGIAKEGKTLEASEAEVRVEMAKGFKTVRMKNKDGSIRKEIQKPVSYLFLHCAPVDADAEKLAEEFFNGKEKPDMPETKEDLVAKEADEIERHRKELADLGGGVDMRWGAARLKEEILKQKKSGRR